MKNRQDTDTDTHVYEHTDKCTYTMRRTKSALLSIIKLTDVKIYVRRRHLSLAHRQSKTRHDIQTEYHTQTYTVRRCSNTISAATSSPPNASVRHVRRRLRVSAHEECMVCRSEEDETKEKQETRKQTNYIHKQKMSKKKQKTK